MSQAIFSNIIPTTTSGNQLAQLLNDFKDAIVSGFSGTSRPSQITAGGYWVDITNDSSGTWDFKIYTGVQDITIFTINKNTGLASISSTDTLFKIIKTSDDSVGPILRLLKKRIAGLGQSLVGDTIGEIQFDGTRDDGVQVLQARIKSISQNNVTSTQQGSYLAFEVSTLNAAGISEVLRIIDGKIGVNTTAPGEAIHAVGNAIKLERIADDAVSPKFKIKKKRVASSGQVQAGDLIGTLEFQSTDNTGAEIPVVAIEVSARETHTTGVMGSRITVRNKKLGQSTYTDQIVIDDGVTIKTNFTVEGNLTISGTTTTINSATLDVTDSNITVNKGGNQSAANTNKAGIKVEMSDATHAQIGYDSTKASKFVIGNVGSEKEIADVSSVQTFTNKTNSGGSIIAPVKLEVKQDTEANLTTWAAGVNGTNGQWCFATDSKVMYQVIDNALTPGGSGGGGTTLNWNDSGNGPITDFADGFKLSRFDNVSNQELYAILTVPTSYRAGKQIKLKSGQFFNSSITGNVLFRTDTALIRSTSVLGTYPNIRTSTNTQVAVPGVANTIKDIGVIDLTDTTGNINGVAVAAGDKLRIRLYRDNTNETSGAANDSKLIVDSFEPTFS